MSRFLGAFALGVLTVAFLAASCAPRADLRAEPTEATRPLTFEAVPGLTRIVRFDPPGAGERLELELAVQVHNPNTFGVHLERLSYRVVVNDRAVADGRIRPDRFVEAGGMIPLRFPVEAELPPTRPLLTAVAGAFTGEPLPYRLEGRVRFGAAGYAFESRYGLLVEGSLLPTETVEPPRLRVDGDASRAFEVRPGVPVIQVAIRVRNPGEIGYFLSGKDVALALAGHPVATLDVEPLPMPAGSERPFALLFYPDPDQLEGGARRALDAALRGIPTAFEVRGGLAMDVLGVASFPVPGGIQANGFVYAE
ncbi:MAG: LEA type 2 family protein [Trueperaceae bacterium]|nr:LEA type 2 family protein [Trueperaceae bacterium]